VPHPDLIGAEKARVGCLQERCERLLAIDDADDCSAWDLKADGGYVRRQPAPGEERRAAQEQFIQQAKTFD
jgi:hypothetical protein